MDCFASRSPDTGDTHVVLMNDDLFVDYGPDIHTIEADGPNLRVESGIRRYTVPFETHHDAKHMCEVAGNVINNAVLGQSVWREKPRMICTVQGTQRVLGPVSDIETIQALYDDTCRVSLVHGSRDRDPTRTAFECTTPRIASHVFKLLRLLKLAWFAGRLEEAVEDLNSKCREDFFKAEIFYA